MTGRRRERERDLNTCDDRAVEVEVEAASVAMPGVFDGWWLRWRTVLESV